MPACGPLRPGRLIHQRLREDGTWEETGGWLDYNGDGHIRLHVGEPPEDLPIEPPPGVAGCLMRSCTYAAEADGLCGRHHQLAYPSEEGVAEIKDHIRGESARHQRNIDSGIYRKQWDRRMSQNRGREENRD